MVARHIMAWATRLAESHPFVWKIAWEAVHHLPFLLPHDKSYHALRHFIKAAPRGSSSTSAQMTGSPFYRSASSTRNTESFRSNQIRCLNRH